MLITRHSRFRSQRRGIILLVVLTMLTLFTIVGITFVFVADGQATSARIARQAETTNRPDIDPEAAFSFFLGQLNYDHNDDTVGVLSALRGQSLGRNMYGWNDATATATVGTMTFNYHTTLNDKPYSGTGRLRIPFAGISDVTRPNWNNEAFMMNFTAFAGDGFIRHPEKPSILLPTPPNPPNTYAQIYTGGFNVPYTYPDHNNFYLAEIDPNTGALVVPSFHREYLFGRFDYPAPADLANIQPTENVNWTNKIGKYLTLRPRPIDQLRPSDLPVGGPLATLYGTVGTWPLPWDTLTMPQQTELNALIATLISQGRIIPYPTDRFGDVKNLDNAPGGCDSNWIDINAPVMQTSDGRRYKMMVAPLIMSLDQRLDLNVIGNILGVGGDHRSHQGWGPWEINPKKVLNFNATEWQRLFAGTAATGLSRVPGRYDTLDPGPPPPGNPAARRPVGLQLGGGARPRGWAQADYDGKHAAPADFSIGYSLPAAPNAGSYTAFPTFQPLTFQNGNTENNDHPALYAIWAPVFNPPIPTGPAPSIAAATAAANARNRRLPLSGMAQLLRFGGTGSEMQTSDALRLLPNNLVYDTNPAAARKRRNLVTLLTADLDRPGATPWVWDPTGSDMPAGELAGAATTRLQVYQLAPTAQFTLAGNNAIPFPQTTSRTFTPGPATGTEFDISWRSRAARLPRVNLYRRLTEFPEVATGLLDLTNAATDAQVRQAITERQQFATELYDVLRVVTGATDPTTAYTAYSAGGATAAEKAAFRALRYLAQLAVNIVDYIDNDGYSTPFLWFNVGTTVTEYVYGVETPRLAINETYVQYDNDDAMLVGGAVPPGANYNVNVWVELKNPMINDAALSGRTDTTAFLQPSGAAVGDHPYRILLCNEFAGGVTVDITNTNIRHIDNPEGDPNFTPGGGGADRIKNRDPITTLPGVRYWGPAMGAGATAQAVTPGAGLFDNPTRTGAGFWVIGPEVVYTPATADPGIDATYSNFRSPRMSYQVPANVANNTPQRPTVVLQRLANPALPHNPNRTTMDTMGNTILNVLYNPYITVDVVDNAAAQVMDGRIANTVGALVPVAMDTRQSFGRSQPYAGVPNQRFAQLPAPAPNPNAGQPRHSFLRVNSFSPDQMTLDMAMPAAETTLKLPFDWMTHLDRIPISPAELLQVTHCRPMELTQFFVDTSAGFGTAHNHLAPWTEPSARLYRFFEFLHTAPVRSYPDPNWPIPPLPSNSWTFRGRTPGRVNINGAWSVATLQALADAPATVNASPSQGGNIFTEAQVNTIFQNLLASRSPGSTYVPATDTATINLRPTDNDLNTLAMTAGHIPAGTVDRPFWSMAMGRSAAVAPDPLGALPRGKDNTIFRDVTVGAATFPLFDVPGQTHPHKQKELLTKIFNHITTRSNVFAVWLTVGVFEVGPQGQIMAEIGKSENRHTRHRMFAIVDRTQMRSFTTTGATIAAITPSPTPQAIALNPQGATNVPAVAGTSPALYFVRDGRTGRDWLISDGTTLTYDPNTYLEETVTVRRDPTTGDLTAVFTKPHANNGPVICRGNPGPWTKYDPRQDNEVVPFFAIID